MGKEPPANEEPDPFVGYELYPDATVIFSWQPSPLEDVKDESVVVLDTNVLAIPYQTGSQSLEEIGLTYRKLADEHRLVIPGQVAREFANVRAVKIADLLQQIGNQRSRA